MKKKNIYIIIFIALFLIICIRVNENKLDKNNLINYKQIKNNNFKSINGIWISKKKYKIQINDDGYVSIGGHDKPNIIYTIVNYKNKRIIIKNKNKPLLILDLKNNNNKPEIYLKSVDKNSNDLNHLNQYYYK